MTEKREYSIFSYNLKLTKVNQKKISIQDRSLIMNLSLVLVYIESWDGIMARMRRMDRTRGKDGDVSL